MANQVSLRVGETLTAKMKFERFADEHGIKIQTVPPPVMMLALMLTSSNNTGARSQNNQTRG